jgi:glutamate dehydrogenase/leucine dehydrogenase
MVQDFSSFFWTRTINARLVKIMKTACSRRLASRTGKKVSLRTATFLARQRILHTRELRGLPP